MTYQGYTPRSQKGFFGNVTLWVIGILVLVGLVGGITFGVRWLTAPAKGKLQAREQINSGSFRIAAYNPFLRSLCGRADRRDSTRRAANRTQDRAARRHLEDPGEHCRDHLRPSRRHQRVQRRRTEGLHSRAVQVK